LSQNVNDRGNSILSVDVVKIWVITYSLTEVTELQQFVWYNCEEWNLCPTLKVWNYSFMLTRP